MAKPLKDADKARKILEANLTPRYRSLDTLEAYVEGRQYDGLKSWFDDGVPLVQRAPCVVEPIVESAIESYQDLVFGDGRFPQLTAHVAEDDKAFDPRFGLDSTQSAQLQQLINAAFKQADVAQVSREALAQAMSSRSVVGIACVRDGKLAVDLAQAKCCTPTFDPKRPTEVISLEIKYPYLDIYWDNHDKTWAQRCMIFRRVIDAQTDTTFFPFKAEESGEQPAAAIWRVNPDLTFTHGLGFCPVVWYAYRKLTSKRQDFDGVAIHERLLDEIDALNRTLSQRHRAGLYCGDPQIVETGVSEDENPAAGGVPADPFRSTVDQSGRLVESGYSSAAMPGGARKKGPGTVWRYPSAESKVSYLTIPAESLKPLDEETQQLRSLLSEGLSWVRPLEAGSSNSKLNVSRLSGKTLSLLYKRQTSQCDTIRPDAWSSWLYPLTNLLLRIIYTYAKDASRADSLYLGGVKEAASLLARFDCEVEGSGLRWFKPALSPIWGAYFKPDEQDQLTLSAQLKSDFETGFITLQTAVEKQAEFYNIADVSTYLETLTAEVEERKKAEQDAVLEEAKVLHDLAATENAGAD